jgi:uncharacterized membrane protein YhdT
MLAIRVLVRNTLGLPQWFEPACISAGTFTVGIVLLGIGPAWVRWGNTSKRCRS